MLRIFLALWLAFAPALSWAGSMSLLGAGVQAASGGCSQYTAWLTAANAAGSPTTLEKTTVQNLICNLVNDGNGTWAAIDALYWFPVDSPATAAINLKNPGTFNLSTTGTCSFTAGGSTSAGWAGDASTCAGNTGYTPSTSGQITQNNISLGAYITVGPDGNAPIGASDTGGGALDFLGPGSGGHGNAGLNDGNFASLGTAAVQGNWVLNRNSSSSFTALLNGTALTGSPFTSASSSTPVNQTISIWAQHGAVGNNNFTGDKLISTFIGGSLSIAGQTSITNQLHTACVAMGINLGSGC